MSILLLILLQIWLLERLRKSWLVLLLWVVRRLMLRRMLRRIPGILLLLISALLLPVLLILLLTLLLRCRLLSANLRWVWPNHTHIIIIAPVVRLDIDKVATIVGPGREATRIIRSNFFRGPY
jgi:hypothetical protein